MDASNDVPSSISFFSGQKPEKKKVVPITPLLIGVALLLFGLFLALIIESYLRSRDQGYLGGCAKGGLHNIAVALEMYAKENNGKYPSSFQELTPEYFKKLPQCPAAGTQTYKLVLGPDAPRNDKNLEDFYFLYCEGHHHARINLPSGYPQYDSVSGLIER